MGYYFTLTNVLYEVDKLCTIVLPLMKHEYLLTSHENPQLSGDIMRKINTLLYGFEFICVYIVELLILP